MKISVQSEIELPTVPNFVRAKAFCTRTPGEHASVDIADLSDDELRQIGEQWTVALLAHARRRRTRGDAI